MPTILVVDDHPSNRDLMVTLCRHLGHECLEAADGVEALLAVRARQPDLVICDILMPTMDGYEFVHQLRADPAIAHTEVIFYTATYRELEARSLARAVGVTRIIVKPCDPAEVMHVIETALAHTTPLPLPTDRTAFDREHLRLVNDTLLDKAEELQRANQRLASLTDLNLQLASERDPHELLEKVCRGARELLGARYGFLCIKAKNNGQAIYLFSSGLPAEEAAKLTCPLIDKGRFGEVMAQRLPLRFQNPGADPQAVDFPPGYPDVQHGLLVPVESLNCVYGWICLVNKVGAHEFSEEDERILQIHAAQVGRIYENGSLYAQVQRRNLQLQSEIEERERAEEEVRYKNSILRTEQQTSLDAILLVDENGRIVSYNQRFIETFQLSERLVEAGNDDPVLSAFVANVADPEAFLAKVRYLYEHKDEKSNDEFLLKDGRIIDRHSAPVRSEEGVYYGRVWYFRDITELRMTEEKIRRLNRVYATLSQINALIVRVRSREELFCETVKIATEAGQFSTAWIGSTAGTDARLQLAAVSGGASAYVEKLQAALALPADSLAAKARERMLQRIQNRQPLVLNDLEQETWVPLWAELIANGSRSMVWLPLVMDGQIAGVLALHANSRGFFDADEMKLLQELAGDIAFAIHHLDKAQQLDYLAYYDQLTGLANTKLLHERLTQHLGIAERQSVALVLLDVERFKNINDALGRQAGDSLLQQLAERLVVNAGGPEFIARLSADHFAMILPGLTDERDVARMVEECGHACFDQVFHVEGTALKIAAKVGIALYPTDGGDADTLFSNAEAALKKAKASGAAFLFYSASMNDRIAETLALESKLRLALDLDQFVLHYQPKIDSATGRIGSVEALIRWNDPATGLVPPIQFIPLLEETGLILKAGAWALRQAVRDHDLWVSLGLAAPRVAINVSAIQLQQGNFLETVRQAMAEVASPPGIDLEITESMIIEDVDGSIAKLNAIRDMGVEIAIDDFGTGYSSLTYLARLPVHEVKIDRSFITTMLANPNTMTLVSTIISLSHALGLKVVAEGVDEEEQASVLRQLGCDKMQGYLFSKPVPCAELITLLQRDATLR